MILYCDGASRGNPGPSALGFVLMDDGGRVVRSEGRLLPHGTNNQAEYQALLAGLDAALEVGTKLLVIRADSELMIRQLSGRYRVRNSGLLPLYEKAVRLISGFESVRLEHVPRSENKHADRLANEALDRKTIPGTPRVS